jgi:hypothetical protein
VAMRDHYLRRSDVATDRMRCAMLVAKWQLHGSSGRYEDRIRQERAVTEHVA